MNDPSKPPSGSNVRTQKLAVLERPYPQVVAGTPSAFSYDTAADVFHLAYSTARASGGGSFPAGSETDVFVPALHYPDGYAVRVTGAAPVSNPHASILRLVSCAGRTTVTVDVAPSGTSSTDCAPPVASANARPSLLLKVDPQRVTAGGLVRFTLTVTAVLHGRRTAIAGAGVTLAGHSARTGRAGRALLTLRLHSPGIRTARATKAGFRAARAGVTVVGAEPEFTG